MSKERADEFSDWAGRLEQPEGVPGLNLADKGAAWEKLYGRLKEQPLHPKIQKEKAGRFWYWIAAACLILALIPAAMVFKNEKREFRPLNGDAAVRIEPALPVSKNNKTQTEKLVNPDSPANPETREKTVSREFPKNGETSGKRNHKDMGRDKREKQAILADRKGSGKDVPVIAVIPAEDSSYPSGLIPPRSVDSGQRLAQLPSILEKTKKEIRVVHINEINDPATTGASLTNNPVSGGFRINFGYRGRLNHPSVATYRPDPSVFKIKTSSQNP